MKNFIIIYLLIFIFDYSRACKLDITVTFDQATPQDTLFLTFQKDFFLESAEPLIFAAAQKPDGTYHFVTDVPGPGKFSIKKRLDPSLYKHLADFRGSAIEFNELLHEYSWKEGPAVRIDILKHKGRKAHMNSPFGDFDYYFSGADVIFYRAKARSDSAYYRAKIGPAHPSENVIPVLKKLQPGLDVLALYQDSLDAFGYGLLKAEMTFQNAVEGLVNMRFRMRDGMAQHERKAMLATFDKHFSSSFESNVLADSPKYLSYCHGRKMMDSLIVDSGFVADSIVASFFRYPDGLIKDRLIAHALLRSQSKDKDRLVKEAAAVVKDLEVQTLLNKMLVRSVGGSFDFQLPDSSGRLVTLDDFKGKAVLVDFWFTGCGACVTFYSDVLSKVEKRLEGKDIAFVTISIDAGKAFWQKSVRSEKYTSPLATNLYTAGQGSAHPMLAKYMISNYPTLILLDKEGRILDYNSKQLHEKDSDRLAEILLKASRQ